MFRIHCFCRNSNRRDAGSQTTWELTDTNSTVIISEPGPLASQTHYLWTLCLDSLECYDFTIYDSGLNGFGNPFSPTQNHGLYNLYSNGNNIFSSGSGNFGANEVTSFGSCPNTSCSQDSFTIIIKTDLSPQQTAWQIIDVDSVLPVQGPARQSRQ